MLQQLSFKTSEFLFSRSLASVNVPTIPLHRLGFASSHATVSNIICSIIINVFLRPLKLCLRYLQACFTVSSGTCTAVLYKCTIICVPRIILSYYALVYNTPLNGSHVCYRGIIYVGYDVMVSSFGNYYTPYYTVRSPQLFRTLFFLFIYYYYFVFRYTSPNVVHVRIHPSVTDSI